MKSCLIVDDSKVIRKVARHILETLNSRSRKPATAKKRSTRCEAKMPDVVLLDWNMPVMSGMEFLKMLRQRGHSATSRRSCSAPPRTTWRIFARRSKQAPTNT